MSARSTGSSAGQIGRLDWGREICGRLELSERREWLCNNGLSGIASDTVAGIVRAWMEIASSSEPRA